MEGEAAPLKDNRLQIPLTVLPQYLCFYTYVPIHVCTVFNIILHMWHFENYLLNQHSSSKMCVCVI